MKISLRGILYNTCVNNATYFLIYVTMTVIRNLTLPLII